MEILLEGAGCELLAVRGNWVERNQLSCRQPKSIFPNCGLYVFQLFLLFKQLHTSTSVLHAVHYSSSPAGREVQLHKHEKKHIHRCWQSWNPRDKVSSALLALVRAGWCMWFSNICIFRLMTDLIQYCDNLHWQCFMQNIVLISVMCPNHM